MKAGHDVVWVTRDGQTRPECRCGWTVARGFESAHPAHAKKAQADDRRAHRRWYIRTHHCGQCGQPGNYCICTSECGCAKLHTVGSGLAADALTQFADNTPADQGELFA